MNLLKLLAIILSIFLFFGCAEKKPVTIKEFFAQDLEDFLNKMKTYDSVEGVLNLQYEAKNSILNGDASLKISKDELLLRVYYMGFPTGELYEEKGEVLSNLPIEKDRLRQLAIGIRKGFIWWDGDFSIEDKGENYILKDRKMERNIVLNKDSFIPLSQSLNVEGQTILITYNNLSKIQTEDGTLLKIPLEMIVFYKNRTLKIKIERIKFKNAKKNTSFRSAFSQK